jgi:hypothetical protein
MLYRPRRPQQKPCPDRRRDLDSHSHSFSNPQSAPIRLSVTKTTSTIHQLRHSVQQRRGLNDASEVASSMLREILGIACLQYQGFAK